MNGTMDRKSIKRAAKSALMVEGWKQIITFGIFGLVFVVLQIVSQSTMAAGLVTLSPSKMILGGILAIILSLIISLYIIVMLDTCIACFKMKRAIGVKDILTGMDIGLYLKCFGYSIIVGLIALAVGIPFGIVDALAISLIGAESVVTLLIMLVSYIGMLVLIFVLVYNIIMIIPAKLDVPNRTFKECMSISKQVMKGKKGFHFVMILSFFPWLILCVFANILLFSGLVIMYAFVLPYIMISNYIFFIGRCNELGIECGSEEAVDKTVIKDYNYNKGESNDMEVAEAVAHGIRETVIDCIKGAKVVDVVYQGVVKRALPLDVVIKNGEEFYNMICIVDGEKKPVQMRASDVTGVNPNGKTFNPATFVTWKPNWNIPRDWNI